MTTDLSSYSGLYLTALSTPFWEFPVLYGSNGAGKSAIITFYSLLGVSNSGLYGGDFKAFARQIAFYSLLGVSNY